MSDVMKPDRPVGIVGYGAYVPRFRISGEEISRVWTGHAERGPVKEKSVPGSDGSITIGEFQLRRSSSSTPFSAQSQSRPKFSDL